VAVIIREEKVIEGKKYAVKVYRTESGRFVTERDKKKAEEFDRFLAEKIREIEGEMKNGGLLTLKGQKGRVHKLWYEVGKRLEFVMDTSLVAAGDRRFVWRAIYDHVKELHSGPVPERAIRDPETSHFAYCYRLSGFPREFVEMAGDWTSWSEFFDRRETRNEPRIIEWLGKKASESKVSGRQAWLRPLTKAIHREFGGKVTTVFSTEELYQRLDKVFSDLKENGQEQE
jgi:hypothetical protein